METILHSCASEIVTALVTLLVAFVKMKLDKKRMRKDLKRIIPNGQADFILR